MPVIGEYSDHIERYPRTLASADAQGEEVESWAAADPAQKHWAKIEAPAGSETSAAIVSSGGSLRVRFRHLVPLEAVDHLYLTETGLEYSISGVWRERAEGGGWQTVCSISGPV